MLAKIQKTAVELSEADRSAPAAVLVESLPIMLVDADDGVTEGPTGDRQFRCPHVSWVRRAEEHARPGEPGSIEEELRLHVGGLVSPAGDHLHWLDRALDVGDEVTIRIAEGGRVNRPRSRQRRDHAKEVHAQKRYVRNMAKKFGWKIQTQ